MKKTIALFVLVAVAIVAAAIVWMRGNLDGLVRTAIINYGSAMLQTTIQVDQVNMTPADGRGVISGLRIGNPAGFKTPHIVKVGEIDIEIDVASVAQKVIVIRRIAILAPEISYEKGATLTNVEVIQNNITRYLGPGNTAKPGKKLIVEQLVIRDAKANVSASFLQGKALRVALPDITMKDVGKARGGLTGGELGQEIAAAMKSRLTGAVSFDKLWKSTGNVLNQAGSSVKGLFK